MKYFSIAEVSERVRYSKRRLQQMCKAGEIEGAVKTGNRWRIPESYLGLGVAETILKKKLLPIGISDYRKAVTGYYYVDKTLLIRDFLDHRAQVSLFTRPRRFGKTLNMDMLRVFFEVSDEDRSVYFRDQAIWECGDAYTSFQGKYPVIYLSFKDVKYESWDKAISNLSMLIATEYDRHRYLLDSECCSETEKNYFVRILKSSSAEEELSDSLKHLSRMLRAHYGRPAVIMIDEYDTPIQQGFLSGYYDQVIGFIRNLFSGGFKDNPNLEFGFLTGILRVARESIFSGMNNLKVYGITDDLYSEYFGFTKEEVRAALDYYGGPEKMDEVCEWYDGYRFGDHEIFNPWSVINYLEDGFRARAFWRSTGSNEIIGDMIASADGDITDNMLRLMQGGSVNAYIDSNVIYPEVKTHSSNLFSFLLMTGYLRLDEIYPQPDGNDICEISIPNKEISYVYEKEIIERYPISGGRGAAIEIQQAVFNGNVEGLQRSLESYIAEVVSYFDPHSEGFYQGLMLGLCAVLNNRFKVRSNRESGEGRFDLQLEPMIKGLPGFIFELKFAKSANADLEGLEEEALTQIEAKKYDTEMKSRGIERIIKVGIAFAG